MNLTLYLEIGSVMLFLVMVAQIQVDRAAVPGTYSRHPRMQMLWLAMVFVLLCMGLGASLYNVSPLLAIALAAGFTLSLLHPANALCFFILMQFLRPWEILDSHPLLLALPRLLALACLVSWLLYQGKPARPTRQTMPALVLLLGFSVWLFLTTWRVSETGAVQMEWFDRFLKPVIVFLMCLYTIEDKHSVLELKRTLIISSFALILLSFYRFFFLPQDAGSGGRLHWAGMMGDSNDLAAGMIIALPLALLPVWGRLSTLAQRMRGVFFSGLALAAIWFSQSRGALLALVAQLSFFGILFKVSGRRIRIILISVLVGVGYFVVPLMLQRSAAEMGVSQESRIIYWKAALRMTLHNPIWGVGFGQYPARYETYAPAIKYEWGERTAHSSWLLAFAESGLIGGTLFIAFFLVVWRTAWAHRRENPDLFYALVGYGVAMSFLSHTYMLYPYLLAGLILAAGAVRERAAYER